MERLYTQKEKGSVFEKFKINLDEVCKRFLPYEELLDFLNDAETNYKYQNEDILSYIKEKIKNENSAYIKATFLGKSYFYNSLIYYSGLMDSEFRKARDGVSSDIDPFKRALVLFLSTINNAICELVEKQYLDHIKPKKYMLVFEACPAGSKQLKTREEALMIKNICLDYSLDEIFPIIRFGTNVKMFKRECNNYEASFIHFAGHGEGNGDLALVGYGGQTKFLGYSTFLKYFSSEYVSFHPKAKISLIYLNSCYSNKYVEHMKKDLLFPKLFLNTISNKKTIFDDDAISFSNLFYSKLITKIKRPITDIFDDVKNHFSHTLRGDFAKDVILD